jgi:hypothetical protein
MYLRTQINPEKWRHGLNVSSAKYVLSLNREVTMTMWMHSLKPSESYVTLAGYNWTRYRLGTMTMPTTVSSDIIHMLYRAE